MTWRVGDLAVCVDVAQRPSTTHVFVEIGCIYRVVEVCWGGQAIKLSEVSCSGAGYWADRFRKVVKDGTQETTKSTIKELLGTDA